MDVREKQSSENRLIDYYYLAEKIECPGEPLVYWHDIEAAPTVDAVPVVRCRDCRSYNKPKTGWCEVHLDCEHPNGFCSYGERKDDADG